MGAEDIQRKWPTHCVHGQTFHAGIQFSLATLGPGAPYDVAVASRVQYGSDREQLALGRPRLPDPARTHPLHDVH
jgi:hypothetical protein